MSWKRCWSNNHFYYDNDDDQIVPDIDRTPRSTLPNVSTLVDNSSNFHRTIDTGTSSSTVNGKHRSLYAASERIKEVTHQKSPTMSQLSNLHPHPILAFGIKASPLPSSSSHSSPAASPSLSWSKNQVNNWDSYHNSGNYFGNAYCLHCQAH